MKLLEDIDKVSLTATAIAFLVTAMVMGASYEKISEKGLQQQFCEDQVHENATWINDSDDSLDCRAPNGTVVENVSVDVASNHGTTTLGGTNWPAKNATGS
jgi:hypothetical protein